MDNKKLTIVTFFARVTSDVNKDLRLKAKARTKDKIL